MNFANFPFDQQNCEWTYRPSDLLSAQAILKTPNLYVTQSQSYTKYLSTGNAIKLNNHGGLQFDASIQVKDSILVPLLDGEDNVTFSYSGVEFSFARSVNEINKLLISYYFPSGAFAILSLFSFFITLFMIEWDNRDAIVNLIGKRVNTIIYDHHIFHLSVSYNTQVFDVVAFRCLHAMLTIQAILEQLVFRVNIVKDCISVSLMGCSKDNYLERFVSFL